jgi:hypothetical protein
MDHGRVRYQKRKCRCQVCRDANAAYTRRYRRDLRSDESQETVSVVETDNRPHRDETIPVQIVEALKYQDVISYTDGGEGWPLDELAAYLESRENVECVVQDERLYVSNLESLQSEISSWPMPRPPIPQPRETIANSLAKPRIAPRVPIANAPAMPRIVPLGKAPTVPTSSNRIINNLNQ